MLKKSIWIKPTPVSQSYCSHCGTSPKVAFGIIPPYCPWCGSHNGEKVYDKEGKLIK